MKDIDEVYVMENLITVDLYQFNAVLFSLLRQQLPSFINKDSIQTEEPFLSLITDGRYILVRPNFPDRRFYAPKVDYDLWVEFENIDPEGAKSRF